jgi:hypothetical protein
MLTFRSLKFSRPEKIIIFYSVTTGAFMGQNNKNAEMVYLSVKDGRPSEEALG